MASFHTQGRPYDTPSGKKKKTQQSPGTPSDDFGSFLSAERLVHVEDCVQNMRPEEAEFAMARLRHTSRLKAT